MISTNKIIIYMKEYEKQKNSNFPTLVKIGLLIICSNLFASSEITHPCPSMRFHRGGFQSGLQRQQQLLAG